MEVTVPSRQLEVFWDGKCPLCMSLQSQISMLDSAHRLTFLDFRDPSVSYTAAPRFRPQDLAAEMTVRMPDGTWRTGYFAWAEIARAIPSLNLIGKLMKLWIFADIGPKVYKWIADNRFEISRVLHLPEPCLPDGTCRIGAQ